MTRLPRTEPYPASLRQELRRAARLSHALSLFAARVGPTDPSFGWLCTRIEELRAAVGRVTCDWTEARLDPAATADRLRGQVRELEESLHAFARSSFPARSQEPTPAYGTTSAPALEVS